MLPPEIRNFHILSHLLHFQHSYMHWTFSMNSHSFNNFTVLWLFHTSWQDSRQQVSENQIKLIERRIWFSKGYLIHKTYILSGRYSFSQVSLPNNVRPQQYCVL